MLHDTISLISITIATKLLFLFWKFDLFPVSMPISKIAWFSIANLTSINDFVCYSQLSYKTPIEVSSYLVKCAKFVSLNRDLNFSVTISYGLVHEIPLESATPKINKKSDGGMFKTFLLGYLEGCSTLERWYFVFFGVRNTNNNPKSH